MLLNIEKASRYKQKELLISYVIEALDEYFETINQKKRVIEFVKTQLESKSPKTRKTAERFLESRST